MKTGRNLAEGGEFKCCCLAVNVRMQLVVVDGASPGGGGDGRCDVKTRAHTRTCVTDVERRHARMEPTTE